MSPVVDDDVDVSSHRASSCASKASSSFVTSWMLLMCDLRLFLARLIFFVRCLSSWSDWGLALGFFDQ